MSFLFQLLIVTVLLVSGCATPETKVGASVNRSPVKDVLIVVDKDLVQQAFSEWTGNLFGPKYSDPSIFLSMFSKALTEQAASANLNARVHVDSWREMTNGHSFASSLLETNRTVVLLRMSGYRRLQEALTRKDLGWRGSTNWEFNLLERNASNAYARTWSAVVMGENLNPSLCASYERCGWTLAAKVFEQMKKDGVIQ